MPMKSPSKEDSFSNSESQLADSDHKNIGIDEFDTQKISIEETDIIKQP